MCSDDAMAIFVALQSPEVEVIGLTTIYGNVYTTLATRNALHLVKFSFSWIIAKCVCIVFRCNFKFSKVKRLLSQLCSSVGISYWCIGYL